MLIKKQAYIVVLVIVAGLLYLAAQVLVDQVQMTDTTVSGQKELIIGEKTIHIEIVDSISSRAKGLSGRDSLEKDSGMLFVFGLSDYHSFWMKGMKFPLDIIWIDENFFVVDVTKNAKPESFPDVFRPSTPARYVLEVKAGFASENSVISGTKVFVEGLK